MLVNFPRNIHAVSPFNLQPGSGNGGWFFYRNRNKAAGWCTGMAGSLLEFTTPVIEFMKGKAMSIALIIWPKPPACQC
jgi:hypothetical protein